MIFVTEMFYIPAISAVKISVLLLYRRLFPSKMFLYVLLGVGGFVLCYTVVQGLTTFLQCIPISGAWDPAVYVKARCVALDVAFIVNASLNVLTDVTTLCLPLPFIWRLQIKKERKLQLIGIFLLGGS